MICTTDVPVKMVEIYGRNYTNARIVALRLKSFLIVGRWYTEKLCPPALIGVRLLANAWGRKDGSDLRVAPRLDFGYIIDILKF